MKNKPQKFWIITIIAFLSLCILSIVAWRLLFHHQTSSNPSKVPSLERKKEENPPLNPDSVNLENLHDYLKREQYGSAPLEKGDYWNSRDSLKQD